MINSIVLDNQVLIHEELSSTIRAKEMESKLN